MNFSQTLLITVTLLITRQVAFGDEGAGVEFFEKRIRPVLVRHCYECHSAASAELKGGLRLDSRDFTRNPSRVSMLSGLYPTTNGVLRLHTQVRAKLPEMVTLPRQFRRHGYTLRSIGKIFHQPDPPTFAEAAKSPKPLGPEVWDPWMEPPFGRVLDEPEKQGLRESLNRTPQLKLIAKIRTTKFPNPSHSRT